jgi:hypothetical protein
VDVDAQQWPSPPLAPSQEPFVDRAMTSSPSLPPALEHHEPELLQMPVVTRAYEHTIHPGPELIGTSPTRVLAAVGWLGSVAVYTIAAVALSKSYRHMTADNWRAALDEIRWLLPLMVSSFAMAYLGWVVWTTLAAINGHRVAPLASSPWLPPFAYLVGPAAAAAASLYRPELDHWWIIGGAGWVCIGHGVVLLSLRSSARRIGADAGEFTKLMWFPLASIGYRVIATVVLPDTSFDNSTWFAVLVTIDVVLMMSTAVAVWRAMHSFDQACARDRYSSVENQLPAFMASVHR